MNSIFERIPIVDVDAHISEPYDLWTSRVASKWGDQVPHVIKAPGTNVDYWAIDVYPIIWDDAQLPTTRSDIVIDQISGYRTYLDTMPSEVDKPIIVTEVGLHWGFDGITYSSGTCPGAYRVC